MPLLKFVTHLIKIISCLPFTRDQKDTNELDLKVVKGLRNISCYFIWANLIVWHQINDKDILSLYKFNQILLNVQKREQCKQGSREFQKLGLQGYQVPFFNSNGQCFCNTHLNGLNRNPTCLDIVQDFQPLCFHDLPQFSQFQMPFWRAREIFVQ